MAARRAGDRPDRAARCASGRNTPRMATTCAIDRGNANPTSHRSQCPDARGLRRLARRVARADRRSGHRGRRPRPGAIHGARPPPPAGAAGRRPCHERHRCATGHLIKRGCSLALVTSMVPSGAVPAPSTSPIAVSKIASRRSIAAGASRAGSNTAARCAPSSSCTTPILSAKLV